MHPDVCIYHGNCPDGFTAAWAVWKRWPDVEFVAGFHGKQPPDVTGKHVLLVDFSYKKATLVDLATKAASITILDHHKSAQADLEEFIIRDSVYCENIDDVLLKTGPRPGNIRAIFRTDRCGAQMAWDFTNRRSFQNREPRPKLVEYVADLDLWLFKLANSQEVSAVITSYAYSFANWNTLEASLESEFESVVAEGRAIKRKYEKDIAELLVVSTREMIIGGIKVKVANLPHTMSSDAASALSDGAPFGACYFDQHHARVFSLRSKSDGGIDVSEIASRYGGGGNRNAAGFQMPIGWEGDDHSCVLTDADIHQHQMHTSNRLPSSHAISTKTLQPKDQKGSITMASALEVKEMEEDYGRLQGVVIDYIAALDNQDEDKTRELINRLRRMTGAPDEPTPQASSSLGV